MKSQCFIKRWIFKIVIPVFCLFVLSPDSHTQIITQDRDSVIQVENNLLIKAKKQRNVALVVMGVGAITTSLNLGKMMAEVLVYRTFDTPAQHPDLINGIGVLVGLGVMAGSLPLFKASKRNKDKALEMIFGFLPQGGPHSVEYTTHTNFGFSAIPGVTVSYRF